MGSGFIPDGGIVAFGPSSYQEAELPGIRLLLFVKKVASLETVSIAGAGVYTPDGMPNGVGPKVKVCWYAVPGLLLAEW